MRPRLCGSTARSAPATPFPLNAAVSKLHFRSVHMRSGSSRHVRVSNARALCTSRRVDVGFRRPRADPPHPTDPFQPPSQALQGLLRPPAPEQARLPRPSLVGAGCVLPRRLGNGGTGVRRFIRPRLNSRSSGEIVATPHAGVQHTSVVSLFLKACGDSFSAAPRRRRADEFPRARAPPWTVSQIRPPAPLGILIAPLASPCASPRAAAPSRASAQEIRPRIHQQPLAGGNLPGWPHRPLFVRLDL